MGNVLKRYNGTSWEAVGGAVVGTVNEYTESSSQAYSCDYVNSIIESGSNANGNWIKYSDGTMICYRTVTGTVNINQAWGSVYYGDVTTEYNFAQEFIETPNVQLRAYPTASASFWIGYGDAVSVTTTSSYKNFALLRPTSYNNLPFKLDILAIGKWK